MRRYEFTEGKSSKFWEIELEGESFTTRWGRIGTDGQEKTQDFDSPAEARKAHDKPVAEKEKKGYRLVSSDEGEAARPMTAKVPVNAELLAQLVDNPDDDARWKVYTDFLLEQGEKWGEVIAAALAGQPDTKRQSDALAALVGTSDGVEATWARGVLEHFDFQPMEYDEEAPMGAVLERVLKHPAGHFVRRLTLGLPPSDDGDIDWSMDSLAEAIEKAGPLPLLESLDMSPDSEHMDQASWRRVGDMRALWKAAPNLKQVAFQGASGSDGGTPAKLGPIDAPKLESFIFQSGGLDSAVVKDLAAAKLPALKHLELWFGQENYGNDNTPESLEKLLTGATLPALKSLELKNSEWEVELIRVIAKSALLPRLEVLDLSMGILCRDAAAELVRQAERFRHLKKLVLDDNYFLPEHRAQVDQALKNVEWGAQKELDGDLDDEYSRYSTVGE